MQFRLRTLIILLAIGPPLLAYWYLYSVPRELIFILYMLVPPLLVAAILGLWTRILFWLLDQGNRTAAVAYSTQCNSTCEH